MENPSRHPTETPKEAPPAPLPAEGLAGELPEGLRVSAERLRVALAAAPIVIFNQDRDVRYTWIGNPALGLKAEEAIGRTDEDLLGVEAARPLMTIKRRVLNTGQRERQEVHVGRAEESGWFDLTVEPLRDPAGSITGITCVAVDVSERKQADADLRESEQRFAKIFRNSPVPLAISRMADGRFLDVNEAFVRLYGYTAAELIGHTSAELGLWFTGNRAAVVMRLEDEHRPQVVEMQARCKNGEIRDLLATVDRIQLGGEPCMVGFLSDITDRRRMEDALRESEARYRTVVEDQTELLARFAIDGTLTFVNEVYCRFFGKTRESLVGSQWHPRAVAEDVPMIEDRLRTLTPANPVVTIENRVYAADDSVRWMQFVNRAFFDATGRLLEMQSVGRDITERKQAEEALRQSETRLRAIFEHGPVGIALGDLEGRLTLANRTFHQILGYAEGELVGSRFQQLTFEEDLSAELPLVAELVAGTRQHYDIEKRYIMKEGRLVWVQLRATALRDPGGRPVAGLVIVQDISARRQTETALRESEDRFRKVIEHSRDGINLLDLKSGKYVLMSPAQVALTGFARDEINQISAAEFVERVHPDDRLISVEQQQKVISGDLPAATAEYRWKVKSGEYRWFSDSRSVIRDERGRAIALVGVSRDITTRKRLEAERAEALARLAVIEELERHRISRELHDQTAQRLVALSVELKNLETHLAAGKAPGRRLTSLRKAVDELQQQVRDIAWDLRTGELVQGGLDHALREYVEEWSERTGVTVSFECRGLDSRRLPTLLEGTLFRVAQEAFANIGKHARARHVSLLLEGDGALVRLTVEDDGCGFDVDAAAAKYNDGQRLGLLGMKERVGLAGGTFLLESSPGAGTTVLVRLPLPKEDKP